MFPFSINGSNLTNTSPPGSWKELTAATDFVVQPSDLRDHLRLGSDTSQDAFLTKLANRAERMLLNYLQMSVGRRTCRLRFDGTPQVALDRTFITDAPIHLIRGPVISVDSVSYIDTDGVEQELTAGEDYAVFLDRRQPEIRPAFGKCWPAARCDRETFWVDYTVGSKKSSDGTYELASTDSGIVEAIIMVADELYMNRSISTLAQLTEENRQSIAMFCGHLRDVHF